MTGGGGYGRGLGWGLAFAVALGLLSGATALALTATRAAEPVPLVLDLSLLPAAAPAVAALSDPAPQVVDEVGDLPDAQDLAEDAAPDRPAADPGPQVPRVRAPLAAPVLETPVAAELALPSRPVTPVETPVETEGKPATPEPKARPKAEKAAARSAPEDPAKAREKPREKTAASASAATAPQASAKAAAGGAVSAKAYAKAVMKKVRATKKRSGTGPGIVVVGFSVAGDGGLQAVQVLKGSGNAALDKVALDHIRRSAPFPAPPEGAGRSFSFEFVGR